MFSELSWKCPRNVLEISWETPGNFPQMSWKMSWKCAEKLPVISQKMTGHFADSSRIFRKCPRDFLELFSNFRRTNLGNVEIGVFPKSSQKLPRHVRENDWKLYRNVYRKCPSRVLEFSRNGLGHFPEMSGYVVGFLNIRWTCPGNSASRDVDGQQVYPGNRYERVFAISVVMIACCTLSRPRLHRTCI